MEGNCKNQRFLVAGSKGMVGRSICKQLKKNSDIDIIEGYRSIVDFTNQTQTNTFVKETQADFAIICAAKVGGIYANSKFPAEFIYENLMIASNIIHACYKHGVKKLLFLGSSCIYPKLSPQPIKEEYLLSSNVEPTNQWYAIAKIAGVKLCQAYNQQFGVNYFSVMPTNLYGTHDNFHLKNSHVIPALIRKFHEAKINNSPNVECWGTGNALREFLFVDDLSSAIIHLINSQEKLSHSIYNVGFGTDVTIRELAHKVSQTVGYNGKIKFNTSMPDGTPKKLLDSSRINNLGWKPKMTLESGLQETYQWFLQNEA